MGHQSPSKGDKNGNADCIGFPFPGCWNDDEVMDELMGPIRLRSINPEIYDAQMQFWTEMIAKFCTYKRCPTFTIRLLKAAFQRKQHIPYNLDKVIAEMLRTKEIRLRADYLYDPLNSWTGWAMSSFVKKPFWWGVGKLPIIGVSNKQEESTLEYVHVDTINQLCKELQATVLKSHAGEVMHYEALNKEVYESFGLDEDTTYLCLHTLHCQQKIGFDYTLEDKERRIHLVKIPGKNDPTPQVTENNRAVHNLKTMQAQLAKQLENLELEIQQNDRKARENLREGKRLIAKTYLRKKHMLEKNHEKRSVALANIETLLSNVEEAQSNGEIVEAYKIGSKALKNVLDNSGLKFDNVDEIISDVRETLDTHNELQDTLGNTGIAADLAETDDALEQELKKLVGETEPKPKQELATATLQVNQTPSIATVTVTDEDLIAMLDNLDAEDHTLSSLNKEAFSKQALDQVS